MFSLRVNGIGFDRLNVRFAIMDGYPGGPLEAAVLDPVLGEVTLTNDCLIEIQHLEDQPWSRTTEKGLLELALAEKVKIDIGGLR